MNACTIFVYQLYIAFSVFGRPFVKRFALCYWTVVCPVLSVCDVIVYYGQTVGWIRMPLGMVIGLGARHIVLDADPSPKRGTASLPNFWPMSVVENGMMDEDATLYGGRPWPRRHCVRWGPSFPPPEIN